MDRPLGRARLRPRRDGDRAQPLDARPLDLSTFEATCRIRRVRERGDVYDLDTTCRGEGGEQRNGFSIQVNGDVLTFVGQGGFPFDPKRFRRCQR